MQKVVPVLLKTLAKTGANYKTSEKKEYRISND